MLGVVGSENEMQFMCVHVSLCVYANCAFASKERGATEPIGQRKAQIFFLFVHTQTSRCWKEKLEGIIHVYIHVVVVSNFCTQLRTGTRKDFVLQCTHVDMYTYRNAHM